MRPPYFRFLSLGGWCKGPGNDTGRHRPPWRSKPFIRWSRGEWRSKKSSALNPLPAAGEDTALVWVGSIGEHPHRSWKRTYTSQGSDQATGSPRLSPSRADLQGCVEVIHSAYTERPGALTETGSLPSQSTSLLSQHPSISSLLTGWANFCQEPGPLYGPHGFVVLVKILVRETSAIHVLYPM